MHIAIAIRWCRAQRVRWSALLLPATLLVLAACASDDTALPARERTLGESIAVNTHFGGSTPVDRSLLAKLHAAGVRTLRNDLVWEDVERQPGKYDFTSTFYDDLVADASAAGLEVLFILDYGNRLYGPSRAVVGDKGRHAFAAFAATAAARYRGHRVAWEIWNEPNLPMFWAGAGTRPDVLEYARLAEAAAASIREADPTVPIAIGAAYTGFPDLVRLIGGVPGVEFLAQLARLDAARYATAMTFHPYRAEPPETVEANVAALRAALAASGRSLALWCGEWGYSTYDPLAPATNLNILPATSEQRQASYVARMFLTNFRLGLEKTVWYQAVDPPSPDPGNMEDHFGLLRADGSEKLAYTALATLVRLVGALPLHSELRLPQGRYGLRFGARRPEVVVLWSTEAAHWELDLGAGARVLDVSGREWAVGAGRVALGVDPDDAPLYAIGNVLSVAANESARASAPCAPQRCLRGDLR